MYKIIFLFLFSFSILANTHTTRSVNRTEKEDKLPFPCPDKPSTKKEFKELLLNIYKPYVKEMTRKVTFYHYGWRTKRYPNGAPAGVYDDSTAIPSIGNAKDFSGPADLKEGSEEYFKKKAAGHFLGSYMPEYGAGLYTSSNPFTSIGYSGKPGLLLQVGVPQGMKYLDFRKQGRKHLETTKENVELFSCELNRVCRSEMASNFVELVKRQWEENPPYISSEDILRCNGSMKEALKEVYKELGVGFITGYYGNPLYPECKTNGKQTDMSEAIFVDPEIASKVELNILVPEIEKNPSQKKRALYEEVLKHFDAVPYDDTKETKETTKAFMEYYGKWNQSLKLLPNGTNFIEHQKKAQEKWKDEKYRKENLTHSIFGCNENFPEEQRSPKP